MRIAIQWGVIYALIRILWTAAVDGLGFYSTRIEYAALLDRLALVLPIVAMTAALVNQRRHFAGKLSLGRAVVTGVTMAVVSAPVIVAATWYYHHVVNPDWLLLLIAHEQQELTAIGMPVDQIAARLEQLRQSGGDRQQIIGGLVGTLVILLLLSLIIAPTLALLERMQRRLKGIK